MVATAMARPSDRDTGVKPSITSLKGVPFLFGFAVNPAEFRKMSLARLAISCAADRAVDPAADGLLGRDELAAPR